MKNKYCKTEIYSEVNAKIYSDDVIKLGGMLPCSGREVGRCEWACCPANYTRHSHGFRTFYICLDEHVDYVYTRRNTGAIARTRSEQLRLIDVYNNDKSLLFNLDVCRR